MLDVRREQEQQTGHWRIRPAWHAFPDLQIQLITTMSCKLDSLAIHQ